MTCERLIACHAWASVERITEMTPTDMAFGELINRRLDYVRVGPLGKILGIIVAVGGAILYGKYYQAKRDVSSRYDNSQLPIFLYQLRIKVGTALLQNGNALHFRPFPSKIE